MDLLNTLAEKNISQALERGEFDNLPGAGLPLNLDDDRGVPPELRVAYRILKNAGYVPPEIDAQRELRDVETLLATAVPESTEYRRGERRLQMLRLRLAESRQGAVLLDDASFRHRLTQKLAR